MLFRGPWAVGRRRQRSEFAEIVNHVRLVREAVFSGEAGPIDLGGIGDRAQKALETKHAGKTLGRQARLRAKAADEGFGQLTQVRGHTRNRDAAFEGSDRKRN